MKKELAILFDCDGVLVDSEPALAQVAAHILNKHDIPAKPEDFAPFIGTGEDTYIGKVMEKYGFAYFPEIKGEIYQAYREEAGQYLTTFDGCKEFLNELKDHDIKIAVASSADLVKVKVNLDALNFDGFDAIISGSDIKRKKPWPDIYLLAAEKAGAKPENCVVVEDATAGIESGKRAGMITIGFTSACSSSLLKDAGADFCADSYAEIRKIFFEQIFAKK